MTQSSLSRGARKVLRVCANAQPDDRILILTDRQAPRSVADALEQASREVGAETTLLIMEPQRVPGAELPAVVAVAMGEATIILAPTSRSVFHTAAVRTACERGARVLTLTGCSERTLMRGAIEADFVRIRPRAETLAQRLSGRQMMRLTTSHGTDLVVRLGAREAVANTSLCHRPGERMGIPDAEVYIAPVEGTSNGVAVIDASAAGVGLIREPVRIEVRDGRARRFGGGAAARAIRKMVEQARSPRAFMVAEVGIGLNPKARVVGQIIEDESAYGTAHIALGNNVGFGGRIAVAFHLDMVMWRPTVEVDDEVIMVQGRLKGKAPRL